MNRSIALSFALAGLVGAAAGVVGFQAGARTGAVVGTGPALTGVAFEPEAQKQGQGQNASPQKSRVNERTGQSGGEKAQPAGESGKSAAADPASAGDPSSAGEMDPAAMEKMMAEWAAPAQQHKDMAWMAGDWELTAKFEYPGMPASNEKGTMKSRMILGDRFLQTQMDMTYMGKPFRGVGMAGYDKGKGRYIQTWADNMNTSIMMMTGQMDGERLVVEGSYMSPMGESMMRIVTTKQSNDQYFDTFYDKIEGEWVQTGVISYVRKAGG
jgi:hypothetical protein